MTGPNWDNQVWFSLDWFDDRLFILEFDDVWATKLQPSFLAWLTTFVGELQSRENINASGKGWHFEVISTTGIMDLNLSFAESRHAAMFKLVYGYKPEFGYETEE
jgi:hypothetical protein